jgi:hypothetical protein
VAPASVADTGDSELDSDWELDNEGFEERPDLDDPERAWDESEDELVPLNSANYRRGPQGRVADNASSSKRKDLKNPRVVPAAKRKRGDQQKIIVVDQVGEAEVEHQHAWDKVSNAASTSSTCIARRGPWHIAKNPTEVQGGAQGAG